MKRQLTTATILSAGAIVLLLSTGCVPVEEQSLNIDSREVYETSPADTVSSNDDATMSNEPAAIPQANSTGAEANTNEGDDPVPADGNTDAVPNEDTNTDPDATVSVTNLPGNDDSSTDHPGPGDPSIGTPGSGRVIGTGNVGGEIDLPRDHPIDSYTILESYPEQIQVHFTGHEPACVAATATAVAQTNKVVNIGTEIVVIGLVVGMPSDAATRNCDTSPHQHTVTITLTEGLDGREVTPNSLMPSKHVNR